MKKESQLMRYKRIFPGFAYIKRKFTTLATLDVNWNIAVT